MAITNKSETINLRAKDIACNVPDDKAIKHAIKLLVNENIISNGFIVIDMISQHQIFGGSRPKDEKPFEEKIRINVI